MNGFGSGGQVQHYCLVVALVLLGIQLRPA
jgi:hypothetical protein